MSDIVEGLMMRRADGTLFNPSGPTAADTITRLTAEVEKLKKEITGRQAHDRMQVREIKHLTAEVEKLKAALQWQPIETAPKDGTEILVSGGTYSWDTDYGRESPHTWVSMASWREQRWQGERSGGHDEYFFYKPTHWMHLPPPPALKENNSDQG
jgi:hypothetical protein